MIRNSYNENFIFYRTDLGYALIYLISVACDTLDSFKLRI